MAGDEGETDSAGGTLGCHGEYFAFAKVRIAEEDFDHMRIRIVNQVAEGLAVARSRSRFAGAKGQALSSRSNGARAVFRVFLAEDFTFEQEIGDFSDAPIGGSSIEFGAGSVGQGGGGGEGCDQGRDRGADVEISTAAAAGKLAQGTDNMVRKAFLEFLDHAVGSHRDVSNRLHGEHDLVKQFLFCCRQVIIVPRSSRRAELYALVFGAIIL